MDIELLEFEKARERIKNTLHYTQIEYSSTLSEISGGKVYLKCENHQKTGSFKIRGATNKIVSMIEKGEKTDVVASSAGNHAQGVAYAAKNYGLKATIVMPAKAPLTKVEATKNYGAEVILYGDAYDDAYNKASEICKSRNAAFVHPYNDIEVIAGQGTIGLEILEEMEDVDIVIVPAGGGGLLAGISTSIKKINPKVKIYGVQSENADALVKSFESGILCETFTAATIADGIAVKKPGDIAFELIKNNVDGMIRVKEKDISDAVLFLIERCKEVVEPAGAASVAAIISSQIDVKGKKVVCITSGGNIDVTCVQDVIERALIARHRVVEMLLVTQEKPGFLRNIIDLVESTGAKILSFEMKYSSVLIHQNECMIYLGCEINGKEHEDCIIKALVDYGCSCTITSDYNTYTTYR